MKFGAVTPSSAVAKLWPAVIISANAITMIPPVSQRTNSPGPAAGAAFTATMAAAKIIVAVNRWKSAVLSKLRARRFTSLVPNQVKRQANRSRKVAFGGPNNGNAATASGNAMKHTSKPRTRVKPAAERKAKDRSSNADVSPADDGEDEVDDVPAPARKTPIEAKRSTAGRISTQWKLLAVAVAVFLAAALFAAAVTR